MTWTPTIAARRTLGRTGIKVSPLCLGAMMFGAWGERDHDECVAVIHRALEVGINFIDTADVYSQGESEIIVGKALANGRRDDVVLATKVHNPMDVRIGQPGGNPNKRGNFRRWIVEEVENSLRRLGTDWIDLYQVHRPDPDTEIEETLAALTDLQRAGKIRAFGSSTYPAYQMVQAQWTSRRSRPRPLRHRATAVLAPRARHRSGRPTGCLGLRDGCDPMESPRGGMAERSVPQGPRRTRHVSGTRTPGPRANPTTRRVSTPRRHSCCWQTKLE